MNRLLMCLASIIGMFIIAGDVLGGHGGTPSHSASSSGRRSGSSSRPAAGRKPTQPARPGPAPAPSPKPPTPQPKPAPKPKPPVVVPSPGQPGAGPKKTPGSAVEPRRPAGPLVTPKPPVVTEPQPRRRAEPGADSKKGRFVNIRRHGGWITVDRSEIPSEASVSDSTVQPVTFEVTPLQSAERVIVAATPAQSGEHPAVTATPTGRSLRIENNTAEGLRIRIQYVNNQGKWEWLTTGAEGAVKRFESDLQAGNDIDLSLDANQIRIWAESSSGLSYKDWSLPEVGDSDLRFLLRLQS
jgi:hypothetical protein